MRLIHIVIYWSITTFYAHNLVHSLISYCYCIVYLAFIVENIFKKNVWVYVCVQYVCVLCLCVHACACTCEFTYIVMYIQEAVCHTCQTCTEKYTRHTLQSAAHPIKTVAKVTRWLSRYVSLFRIPESLLLSGEIFRTVTQFVLDIIGVI